jgi:hypothetical protein
MFAEMKLTDFLEKISAAVGAMGAALGVMTARYSDAGEPEHALDEVKTSSWSWWTPTPKRTAR